MRKTSPRQRKPTRHGKEAVAVAKAATREHVFSLEALLDDIKATTAAAPRYQYPESPSLTWTERGRKPKWYVETIESRVTQAELHIS